MEDSGLPGLMAEHDKIREQVGSLDVTIDQLVLIDKVQNASDWVGHKMESTDKALAQLVKILTDLERGLRVHWQREGLEFLPFLRELGQTEFADTIVSEHRQIAQKLKAFRSRAEELSRDTSNAQRFSAGVSDIKRELKEFFDMLEKHDAKEEQIVFQLGHGV